MSAKGSAINTMINSLMKSCIIPILTKLWGLSILLWLCCCFFVFYMYNPTKLVGYSILKE